MNAKEARETASKLISTKNADEILKVYSMIEKAVKSGEFSVNLYKRIDDSTKNVLEADGFAVQSNVDFRDASTDTYISWK